MIYEWDFENRLIGADVMGSTGTHRVDYRYNADGLRIASILDGEETRFLIDTNLPHAQVLEEYTLAGGTNVS